MNARESIPDRPCGPSNRTMRRRLLLMGIVLAIGPLGGAAAQESFPAKPVHLVVPYPPGGTGDIVARLLAPVWSELLKQPIVVENRGGAGSNIGLDYVAKAAPDGYTIGLFDSALAINPSLYAKMPFDAQRDLTPIMLVARGPLVLVVNPSLPVNTVGELLAQARSKPGALSYASAGSGTPVHLAAEMFKAANGLDIVHVPYKGAGAAVVDVIGGQVPMMFSVPGTVRAHIASGKMRPLAITGTQRFAGMPSVPTFAEQGVKGGDGSIVIGFTAPAKTPKAVIATLHDTLAKALATPELTRRIEDLAYEVVAADPARAALILQEQTELFARVVKSSGAKAE